tara:strand:+ start:978 stop:1247 length:270 start_codon:yes stop_codon:yes gene_type:complete
MYFENDDSEDNTCSYTRQFILTQATAFVLFALFGWLLYYFLISPLLQKNQKPTMRQLLQAKKAERFRAFGEAKDYNVKSWNKKGELMNL